MNTVTRPYTFIEFDTYIQKAKKIFTDSRARRNLSAINNQLQDVQRIMVQNIDDVLQRGTVLSGKKKTTNVTHNANRVFFYFNVINGMTVCLELDTKTQNLSMLTQKYKKDATYLNTKSFYVKAAAGCIVLIVFILYFWVL